VSRALDLRLEPQAHQEQGLRLETYTYGFEADFYAEMRESVYLDAECGVVRCMTQLTPDEARVLANQLLLVADQADEHKARRTSLEDIQEQLRDPDFDARIVHFVHPDVVYAEPGRISEVAKANPGKLVLGQLEPVEGLGSDEHPNAGTSQQHACDLQSDAADAGLPVVAADLETHANSLLVGVVDPLPQAVDKAACGDQQDADVRHLQGHGEGQDHHPDAHNQEGLVPVVNGQTLHQLTHPQPPLSLSITSHRLCDRVNAAMAGTGPEVILHGARVEMIPTPGAAT
jgi:hypothetical protein